MDNPYQARGTLTGRSYIERDADSELRAAIQYNDRYPFFLAPRQSGKSSVMERMRSLLATEDLRIIIIDLSLFPQKSLNDFDQFVLNFMNMVYEKLGLAETLEERLRSLKRGPMFFLESVRLLLNTLTGRIIICIDELDVLLTSEFKDDFLSQIRALFNVRASDPLFKRIQFIVAAAVSQDAFISDPNRSPFNVGAKITLRDFNKKQVYKLVGVGNWLDRAEFEQASDRIHYWTSGSVFLSQSILEKAYRLRCVMKEPQNICELIDNIVTEIIISAPHEIHFKNVEMQLRKQPSLLSLWKNWMDGRVPNSSIKERLSLAGISDEKSPIRNMIYRRVFFEGGTLCLISEAGKSFKYDVILSYSSANKETVHALAERLKNEGLSVWLDAWEIKPGDSIIWKVHQGLEQSRTLIICMSQAYFDSEWEIIKHNTLFFRDPTNSQRRFIPLLIQECILPNMIAKFSYIDWRTPSNETYDKLMAALKGDKGEKTESKKADQSRENISCNQLLEPGLMYIRDPRQDSISIRILEKNSSRRGDIFGKLMADLFIALGYEQPRLNIHNSGQEIDLTADHQLEPHRTISECKATSDPADDADLNKFVCVLDAEQKGERSITGYFISLAGFTETAIEQEKKRRTKVITLTGSQVISELVEGRILIAKNQAIELAGRCFAAHTDLTLDPEAELLAHERGLIWTIYYTQGKARTHFALIHSDGTPLARELAEEVIAADRDCGGELEKITCLNPEPPIGSDTEPRVAEALAAYRQYLSSECGFIQLDGLPADSDVGSRRLRLENLFVPLHLDITLKSGEEVKMMENQAVGSVLAEHSRLALLAAPGGGKSTLVKRLAVAYADPARLQQIADDLPPRDWLPLYFRCRELRDLTRGSFAELLEALSQREPIRQYAEVFRAYVDRALLAGRILLLVDGLDEISDPGDRATFVCMLRTTLKAYPGIAIVVTSREAGFRHVAPHLSQVCTYATLSPFDENDIRRLSVAWHREVVGDTEKVRSDAEQLATAILRNDRIKLLAVNPLLLTTLLLVKRWVGSLPTRRAVLYGKAVEVLLMTWNTEGHEPIPEEEALPQLCYVASAMMLDGVQKISRPKLTALLQEARDAMPTELGYVSGTVDQFVHRVEDRSSLLQMTGHDIEDGRLVEFFEFRHLTFQEFLTARAMVEGWHRDAKETDTLANVLEPHFEKEEWREVIPLAAAMGGKATEMLIQRLTEKVESLQQGERHHANPLFRALGNCLADGAAARPETIRAAFRELIRLGKSLEHADFAPLLARSRYGRDLREEAGKVFLAPGADLDNAGAALAEVIRWQDIESENKIEWIKASEILSKMLEAPERITKSEGLLGMMYLFFLLKNYPECIRAYSETLRRAGASLVKVLDSEQATEQFAASWALAWLGVCRVWMPPAEPDVLGRLFRLWRQNNNPSVQSTALWSLINQPIASREVDRYCTSIPPEELYGLLELFDRIKNTRGEVAVLIVAWYLYALSDMELLQRAHWLHKDCVDSSFEGHALRELLEKLGDDRII